jgi:uncharacterized protein
MKKWVLLFVILCSSFVLAEDPYHLKILAVSDNGVNMTGSDADLFLELKSGTGRVFIDTFPLTKMDTQISTRFAKELACKHFKLDCDRYDFIFTIKSNSNIIGGPSAGAAIAALTTIAVLDLDYDESVAITGTINSGGIVGTVGGVKEKIEAGKNVGLTKVLVPIGSDYGDNETNVTDLEKELGIEIFEVVELDDVLLHITGKDLNHRDISFEIDESYENIMKELHNVLCKRSDTIQNQIIKEKIHLNSNTTSDIRRQMGRAKNASEMGDYYSSASFCFGNNIRLRREFYDEKNLSLPKSRLKLRELSEQVSKLEEDVNDEIIETISDLQTYMVVKERMNDVKQQIDKKNLTAEEGRATLAYAEERFFSAVSWKKFFSMEGKKYDLNYDTLRNGCLAKLSEAEQRRQHASFFLSPHYLNGIQEKIDQAEKALADEEPALCLIMASQAKGDANAILSSLGLKDDDVEFFINAKRNAAERVIAENSADGVFPILGFSYYQYANTLRDTDKFTSLLYLEYALEMSELTIYFPEKELLPFSVRVTDRDLYLLGIGLLLGIVLGLLFGVLRKTK